MDNRDAVCAGSSEAYTLAFSPDIRDSTKMIDFYCKQCPVRLTCLYEAILNDAYGVWGGNTRTQRQELSAIMKFARR